MNIFFGKISQKIDPNQINEGYYIAPQGSSWYGDLKIGDFVYLIGGDKIQFWKSSKCLNVVFSIRSLYKCYLQSNVHHKTTKH
jgi:hypothetical protein